MQLSRNYKFPGTPFSVREELLQVSTGHWDSLKLTVFNRTVECGTYIRNYPTMGIKTFYPFKSQSGLWYALYSAHYTTLRVMRITDTGIEDWCGEDPNPNGFCPGELYVPQYFAAHGAVCVDNEHVEYLDFVNAATASSSQPRYAEFGFVAGCVWGDDGLFKLRHVDLSGVDNRVLTVDERYGYHELPDNVPLKSCITFIDSLACANIATVKTLNTGAASGV